MYIGKDTTIIQTSISVADNYNSVIIGEDCMFAMGSKIIASDFHSIIDVESGERINFSKGVFIGNHVWLGMGSTILKNVEIGDHSIIAAGSMVTGKTPNNCIAGGSPVRVIKQGVTWQRARLGNEILSKEVNIEETQIQKAQNFKYYIDQTIQKQGELIVSGWCFLEGVESAHSDIYIRITDAFKHTQTYLVNKELRQDVADAFTDEKYKFSGFNACCVSEMEIEKIELIIKNNQSYYKMDT